MDESQPRVAQHVGQYTGSETATVVRFVTGLDGVEAWSRLHASHPKVAKHVNHLNLTIMLWEEKWKHES